MCFEIGTTGEEMVFHPYMFKVTIPPLYQEVTNDAQGIGLAEQFLQLAAIWDANLRAEGFIKSAQAAYGRAPRPRRRQGSLMMSILPPLSPEELVLLIAEAKRTLYPEAAIVGGELNVRHGMNAEIRS